MPAAARTGNILLLVAWFAGAILAAVVPGWPFPGAPLVIMLVSAIAWHLARFGPGRPRPAALAVSGVVVVFFGSLTAAGYAYGHMPASTALGALGIAVLMASLFCLAGPRRAG